MKNFKIGKELTSILLNNEDVTNVLDNKIFPLVANAGTTFPFLVYRRSGFRTEGNKDYSDEIVTVELAILSQKYEESVNAADIIADAVDRKETNIIDDIRIVNIYEDYSEDTYIQKISIDIYIK